MRSILPRRTVLQSSCALLSLPLLDCMYPSLEAAETDTPHHGIRPRLLWIDDIGNGVDNDRWYPKTLGTNWEVTPILKPLAAYKKHISVLSGLRQTFDVNGHYGADTFLTGGKWNRNKISIDQIAAKHLGQDVQYPFLPIGPGGAGQASKTRTLSFDHKGRPIPSYGDPAILFNKLFVKPSGEAIKEYEQRMARNESILDGLKAQVADIQSKMSKDDTYQVEAYFDSIRDIEQQIARDRKWLHKPLPEVDDTLFVKLKKTAQKYELTRLALLTERTRVITLQLTSGLGSVHARSHHKGQKSSLDVIFKRDVKCVAEFAKFVQRMQDTKVGDGSLMDYTGTMYGSHMQNGTGWKHGFPFKSFSDSHSVRNLPILFVGGEKLGVKQGKHHLFPKEEVTMSQLYVQMLTMAGVKNPSFNGVSKGLEQLA